MNEEGTKFDKDKASWHLIYWPGIEEAVKALELGVLKYGEGNYAALNEWRIVDAMFRHIISWTEGEVYDKESGLNHMGHIIANAMMLMENFEREHSSGQGRRYVEYF